MSGSDLPQRLRAQPAGRWAGGELPDRTPGVSDPVPAIFDKIGTAFRKAVARFAEHDHIPVVRFTKADRKIDRMRPYIAAQAGTGRSGVAAIGIAQEYANVFTGFQREGSTGAPWFGFAKADRRVSCYYFYLWDADFGPGFVKICAYFPVRHEAPRNRVEVRDLHRQAVAAA